MVKRRGERYKGQRKDSTGRSMSAAKPKFVAPTSGHEDVYFTTGSTKDAAAFQGTVQKLVRHESTPAGWKQGPTLGKAMTNLRDPVFNPSIKPVQQYYSTGGTVTTDWETEGTKNVTVMDDLDYAIKTREYSHKISWYETQIEAWGDTDAKGYALILQHYPEELQAELKNQEVWASINDARSVVWLLTLIKDLQYNKSDRKRLIMATVEADFDLYLCVQGTR